MKMHVRYFRKILYNHDFIKCTSLDTNIFIFKYDKYPSDTVIDDSVPLVRIAVVLETRSNKKFLHVFLHFFKAETLIVHTHHIYYLTIRRWHSGLERWPRERKVGCLNPSRDRPKS